MPENRATFSPSPGGRSFDPDIVRPENHIAPTRIPPGGPGWLWQYINSSLACCYSNKSMRRRRRSLLWPGSLIMFSRCNHPSLPCRQHRVRFHRPPPTNRPGIYAWQAAAVVGTWNYGRSVARCLFGNYSKEVKVPSASIDGVLLRFGPKPASSGQPALY